jgi:hypothetical protein
VKRLNFQKSASWLPTFLIIGGLLFLIPLLSPLIKMIKGLLGTASDVTGSAGSLIGGNEVEKKVIVEANKASTPKALNGFDPLMHKSAASGSALVKVDTCKKLAKDLQDAFGWFSVDFDKVMGVFRQLGTKTQVSFFAYQFKIITGKDLLAYMSPQNVFQHLTYKLSDQQLSKVISYVNSLPNYVAQ